MTLADRLRVSLALSRLQRARLTAEQRADLKTIEEALQEFTDPAGEPGGAKGTG